MNTKKLSRSFGRLTKEIRLDFCAKLTSTTLFVDTDLRSANCFLSKKIDFLNFCVSTNNLSLLQYQSSEKSNVINS